MRARALNVFYLFFALITLQIFSGLLDEKTKVCPSIGTISTALPNEVEYAVEPAKPYRTPIPPYLPKEALVTLQEDILFNLIDFLLKNPYLTKSS